MDKDNNNSSGRPQATSWKVMGLNQCRQQVSPEEGDRVIDAFLVLKIDVGVARAVGLIVEEN